MEKPSSVHQAAIVSLIGIIIFYCVMLGAFYAQVQPHPPARVAPFIGTTLALSCIAVLLVWWRNRVGYFCSVLVGLMSVLSFGPHKLFIYESAIKVLPVIILGSILCTVLIISSIMAWREKVN